MALSQGQRTQDLILPDGGPSAQEMNTIKGKKDKLFVVRKICLKNAHLCI